MWIFGYGSLIWKVDFPYKRKLKGFIRGYSRRFWQGSEDHRGVPGNPGRVVTLVAAENCDEVVWGIAYEIAPEDENTVRQHLNFREKCGYESTVVRFHPDTTVEAPFELDIYVGTEDNPHFLGPASLEDIAQHIFRSKGPSGPNTEYLFNLASAVRENLPNDYDQHLFELDKLVKELCQSNGHR